MGSYVLLYSDNTETFKVPDRKKIYLSRAPQVSTGTATVFDSKNNKSYVIPDGVTVFDTGIGAGTEVSLKFTARTNDKIISVNADVTHPRS
jgi:hypothetical protein